MNRIKNRRALLVAASVAFALPLAACSGTEEAATGETVSNDTLASELADAGSLDKASAALKDSGLAQVFDGTASYTLLAPTDEAFDKIASEGLDKPENKALLAEVLRDHVLPGALSESDIAKAIESNGGKVEMTTMGDTTVTFAMDGDTLTVSGPDGASARVVGEPVLASNGAAMPIDTVLRAP
ncbi:fasciclin domain-containing protein [Croceicoccus naphthovorans]|uniref:fasciclin domain-containing protein n=1 Tax=Croceicoccus naphthovorans TaxID=1348774 RepID=UPI00069CFA53|nr:fasciclin domain-containing protein [Croceicoccus naphthovorans]MBB3988976.1 putative surface protein with fasciclin (FAS1) repeats [Croceicoccus naphthovorans]